MTERTVAWSKVNTGSWNTAGLKGFAPTLADAFAELDAHVALEEAKPFDKVTDKGETETIETGPILRVKARGGAPVQVVMSGHYDTVFPPGTFTGAPPRAFTRRIGPVSMVSVSPLSVTLSKGFASSSATWASSSAKASARVGAKPFSPAVFQLPVFTFDQATVRSVIASA
ncbi:MAG: hypothetical protein AAFN94_18875, partial [Pseudomonadota bacterium]